MGLIFTLLEVGQGELEHSSLWAARLEYINVLDRAGDRNSYNQAYASHSMSFTWLFGSWVNAKVLRVPVMSS